MSAVLDTRPTRLVGVRHPIVQTGMGWVVGPLLVGATAEAGVLAVADLVSRILAQAATIRGS